ncbi:glycine cleavage system protein H [bacterium]|nr:glycine cleavage system protein H [bacterium]
MAKYKDVEMPGDLYYYNSDNHIWAKPEGENRVRCGIDQFGQKAAGTLAYVKVKPVGAKTIKGRALGSIEAGKYIGPVKSPVNGAVLEVNQKILDIPSLINSDSYGEGWMVVLEAPNRDEDLKDLIHGEEDVQAWLTADYKKYEEDGLFSEPEEEK